MPPGEQFVETARPSWGMSEVGVKPLNEVKRLSVQVEGVFKAQPRGGEGLADPVLRRSSLMPRFFVSCRPQVEASVHTATCERATRL